MPDNLLQRFHGHLREVWRLLALSVPRGWEAEANGLICLATGSTSASFNPAFTGGEVAQPRAALDAAHAAYGAAGLRWLLKLHPDDDRRVVQHAQDRGVVFEEQLLFALRLDEAAIDEWPHDELDILPADAANIADAVMCISEAFDADANDVARELGENLLQVPSYAVFIGYVDGEPAATSMLATTDAGRLAGVYSVATRPAYRRRGYGTAITGAAVKAAAVTGHDAVALEPSAQADAMYRQMGFREFGTYLEAAM